ncbi:MAG: hypothetical protein AAGJ93_15210 [Bacteroidota bacterium]
MTELKKKILSEVEQLLEDKSTQMQQQLDAIREDASSSGKSSMGDKYETTREMLKQEELKVAGQLALCDKQLKQVRSVTGGTSEKVANGSLVRSSNLYFMILTGIGKITIDQKEIFVISAVAPIAQQLLKRQVGDSFTFNGKPHQIDELV